MMIDRIGACLYHEHIRAANILQNLKIDLAIAEATELRAPDIHAQIAADALGELRVRASGKDLELFVDQIRPPSYATLQPARPACARAPQGTGIGLARECVAKEDLVFRKQTSGSARLRWVWEYSKHCRTATTPRGLSRHRPG